MKNRYHKYKAEIKERYQARQIRPYALEFPCELTKSDLQHINRVLEKGVIWNIHYFPNSKTKIKRCKTIFKKGSKK